ncbi:hypothetical protein Lbir_0381 [Legionella birminghamensis]|uniref:Uncharacterized protein conserved in bacteria n=1 Tax=Legionella birminghamensis TaxID=28083 RepID=A0A378ID85_9GAMM|nr:putative DNA-binding domain-containing protein [Legionella birminghamensis]KTC75469.1 hypothetical protein Lbir_0381 [Legionella birminghamensis]STX32695.1 Uncharacterized protein conserved in bacteria [Legionella birminghamensis]
MNPSLNHLQTAFTTSLRQADKPGFYQHLVFMSFCDLINPCFPVSRSIIPAIFWEELIRSFIRSYPVTTPLFHQIPGEFVNFLYETNSVNYPFLAELAHYEWMELVIELAQDEKETVNSPLDPLTAILRFSSAASMQHYHYPVEQISVNYLPEEQNESFLIIWRNQDYIVEFMKITDFIYHLLRHMTENKISASEALDLPSNPQREELTTLCEALIKQLTGKQILIPLMI